MTEHAPLRGLYAITSAALCRDRALLTAAVTAALKGGATLVQYRDKAGDAATRQATARALLELCHAHGARLLINDDVDLARAIGADGVHLGASDLPLHEARRRLGDARLIGVSCANRMPRAVAAQNEGANYVAFGRFFPSRTKPDAPGAELSLLQQARAQLRIPVCAIGGITPANVASVVAAGADMVAAVDGVFAAPDVEQAARAYARCFAQ
jgi:thiamine-phosphate pyrophosphorylase